MELNSESSVVALANVYLRNEASCSQKVSRWVFIVLYALISVSQEQPQCLSSRPEGIESDFFSATFYKEQICDRKSRTRPPRQLWEREKQQQMKNEIYITIVS